jgi:integrase
MAANSRVNTLNLLSSMFELAINRGWAVRNPVRGVPRPTGGAADPDIRYLTIEEVEAVLRCVPDDQLGSVERPLYLAAAMTGMLAANCLGFDGATSIGRRSGSAYAATMFGASSEPRNPGARAEVFP